MGYKKEIICLANSIKHHPLKCIAGIELVNGAPNGWIRPISSDKNNEGAVSLVECTLNNGREINPLDIVRIEFVKHNPNNAQSENHLFSSKKWEFVRTAKFSEIEKYVKDYKDLWGAGKSTLAGENDKVAVEEFRKYQDSLRLIRAENFSYVVKEKKYRGNSSKSMRGIFSYKEVSYSLSVTDPFLKSRLQGMAVDKPIFVKNVILVISLSDVHAESNAHYKLIAGAFLGE